MSNSVTLKQIAQLAGVSTTTVHRVLNNKEGCSEELRKRIMQIVREQGYTVNYAAASISKHTLNIALIFPANGWGHNWFLQTMLDGYLAYRREVSAFNVVFQEYYFGADNGLSAPANTLKDLYYGRPIECDGIVMYDIAPSAEVKTQLNRITGKGIPVVMLEKAPEEVEGLCRVTSDELIAGRTAGELMSKFLPCGGTVAVLCQQLGIYDENPQAFIHELSGRCPEVEIKCIKMGIDRSKAEEIAEFLNGIPDLSGVYATSARHTASYLTALEHLHKRPKVAIGSELFTETRDALQAGTLDAIIDKRPFSMGYQALDKMIARVVKGESLPEEWMITPRVILQANCDAYYYRDAYYMGKETTYGIGQQTE